MSNLVQHLQGSTGLVMHQRHELAEIFGFETRNKYEIKSETGEVIGFAAEQHKGIFGFLLRQFLGHWRRFDIFFFDETRQVVAKATHPFRLIFQRLELRNVTGDTIGALQQRFSILGKRFDVQGPKGEVLFEMKSPIWRIWTFKFFRRGQQVASVEKKWAGVLSEFITDKDNFHVSFGKDLDVNQKLLVMASAVFIDLQYFERKAD